jgi:hypothetical protein
MATFFSNMCARRLFVAVRDLFRLSCMMLGLLSINFVCCRIDGVLKSVDVYGAHVGGVGNLHMCGCSGYRDLDTCLLRGQSWNKNRRPGGELQFLAICPYR